MNTTLNSTEHSSEESMNNQESTIDIYLSKLIQHKLLVNDHLDLSIAEMRLFQLVNLRESLVTSIHEIVKKSISRNEILSRMRTQSLKDIEDMDTMLDLFKVEYKSYYIEEHETNKAFRFLRMDLIHPDTNQRFLKILSNLVRSKNEADLNHSVNKKICLSLYKWF